MPYNGNGVFSRIYSWVTDKNNNIDITASRMDTDTNDIVNNGLSAAFVRDGQAIATGNWNLGSYRITLLGSATALTDVARADQVQQEAFTWCGIAGGTANALTLTPSPAITSYVTGARFRFISSASANISATTISISGLTTKAIQLAGNALVANNILASKLYESVFDGTQFQLNTSFAAPGIVTPVTIPLGGTGQITAVAAFDALAPTITRGDLIARGASTNGRLAVGTSGQVLSGGTDPTWQAVNGTQIRMGSDAQGDILFFNGTNYARLAPGTSGQVLQTNGASSNPSWSAAGAVATQQVLTSGSGATYTTPAGVRQLRIRMFGGGGGGAAITTNAGSTGGTTIFNGINANGGSGGRVIGGADTGQGGAGGVSGTGTANVRLAGAPGQSGGNNSGIAGGNGGGNGGGISAGTSGAGGNGVVNTGGGGAGGGQGTSSAGGGGAGEYVELNINSPSATYTYTIGAGGTGGAAGVQAGGNGGSGLIIVEERY